MHSDYNKAWYVAVAQYMEAAIIMLKKELENK